VAAEMITPPPAPMFVGGGKAPPTARVRLVHIATGEVIEAWPIDAKEHIAAGDYVPESAYVAPVAVVTADPPAETPVEAAPAEETADPPARRRR
jgi:hypothetical protein